MHHDERRGVWRGDFPLLNWEKALALFDKHWYTPEQALERGYTSGRVQVAAPPVPPEPPAGQRDQNHQSQQVPPATIQVGALTPAPAIGDVSGRAEQPPLAAVVVELQAEVAMLKAEVLELKEELKQVKTGVTRHDELAILQNEVRALKEQVSGQLWQ